MAAEQPLISIVTPSYNQARFLEETILSVLNQDYPNIEYIIIDGGSTDGSVDIIKQYGHRLAYWVSEPDRGQSDALSKGFAWAHGEILAWLNSDDFYLPYAVRTVAKMFAKHPSVGIVSGACQFISSSGDFISKWSPLSPSILTLLTSNCLPQPSTFFRRSIFEQAGGLDLSFHYAMDYDLWLRLCPQTGFRAVSSILSSYRLHSSSKTVSQNGAFALEDLRAVDKCVNSPVGQELPAATRRQVLCQKLLRYLETLQPSSPEALNVISRLWQITPPLCVRDITAGFGGVDPRGLREQAFARDPAWLEKMWGGQGVLDLQMVKQARYRSLDALVREGLLSGHAASTACRILSSNLMLRYLTAAYQNMDSHSARLWLFYIGRVWPGAALSRTWVSMLLQSWSLSYQCLTVYRRVRQALRMHVRLPRRSSLEVVAD